LEVSLKRVLSLALAGFAALALASSASAGIRITKIYFDSPGSDTGTNSSLNAEYVRLTNTGSKGKSLAGWKVRDKAGSIYTFGTFKLRAGRSVTLHTGNGSSTGTNRYWESGWYIWNNDGDKASLKNKAGRVKDTCSYSGAGSSVSC
jgi:hypothetical protein